MTRRSVSIFSRRGFEDTDDGLPPHMAGILTRSVPHRNTRDKRYPPKPREPKQPKGTILRAVPQSHMPQAMSPLDLTMTTSPRTGDLSAISEKKRNSARTPLSVIPEAKDIEQKDAVQASPIRQRKDSAFQIGVWRDGVAHWDGRVWEKAPNEALFINNDLHAAPHQPKDSLGSNHRSKSRPILSIVIPKSHFRKPNSQAPSTEPQRRISAAKVVSRINTTFQTPSASSTSFVKATSLKTSSYVSPLNERQPNVVEEDNARTILPRLGPSGPDSSIDSTVPSDQDDDASCYSVRSSRTSFENEQSTLPAFWSDNYDQACQSGHQRTVSEIFSLLSPRRAGVFDEPSGVDLNKPLPPSPTFNPNRKPQIHPLVAQRRLNSTVKPTKSAPGTLRTGYLVSNKSCRSLHKLALFDEEFMRTDPYSGISACTSPTFGEIEYDIRAKLRDVRDIPPLVIRRKSRAQGTSTINLSDDTIVGSDAATPLARAPTLPTKSRKRAWRGGPSAQAGPTPTSSEQSSQSRRRSVSDLRGNQVDFQALSPPESGHVRRASSTLTVPVAALDGPTRPQDTRARVEAKSTQSVRRSILVPDAPVMDATALVQDLECKRQTKRTTSVRPTPHAAELVLFRIMDCLSSFDDLDSISVINKGMHRFYKQNELPALQSVHRNMLSASWELRMWSPPLSTETEPRMLDYTAATYKRAILKDAMILEELKVLILDRCQTFLRPCTAAALSSKTDPNARRFDQAFYRIWCFCKIFGGDKGREDDVTGQLDWLKGGLLAHQQGCAATVNANLEHDMCSVLLNAPDHFAKCNEGGMSAAELYDMTELWNCFAALLQGYQGRVEQARANGVYANANAKVSVGNVQKEYSILDEWILYILSLGPHAILDMARLSTDRSEAGFQLARNKGWTSWNALDSTNSRSTFLKEPVARLYEERLDTVVASSLSKCEEKEKKEQSRKRLATLAAEIRLARCSSNYKRLPLIDMSHERPWSVASNRTSMSSTSTRSYTQRGGAPPPAPLKVPNALYGNGASRKVSPIIEDRVQQFDRLSHGDVGHGSGYMAQDATGEAVKRLVDMGFTVAQASEALRVTSTGHGLNLDGAVNMLLESAQVA